MLRLDPPSKTLYKDFDSIEDLHAYAKDITNQFVARQIGDRFYTDNRRKWPEVVQCLATGNEGYIEAANTLLDKFNTEGIFTERQHVYSPNVVGFTPIVPSALMGVPNSMLASEYIKQDNQKAPVNVYFNVSVSAGVSREQLNARGAATLGLALALGMTRPVNLYAYCFVRPLMTEINCLLRVKICENTVDLSRAAYVLCSTDFSRAFCFSACAEMSNVDLSNDPIPWGLGKDPNHAKYIDYVNREFEFTKNDIHITGGYLTDTLMLSNPVQWVKNKLDEYKTNNEAGQ